MATVSVSAASFDIRDGLITGIYPNDKKEEEEKFEVFGVYTQEELNIEIDLMKKGEAFVCKYSREEASFNLLDVVDVPPEMNKEYVLFDVYKIINGFETVTMQLADVESFSAPKHNANNWG